MDNSIIIYFIKVSVSLALFYGLYMLCLKRDTFLKLRRFYFLFAFSFSLLFPAFSIEISSTANVPVHIPTYWLSEIDVSPAGAEQAVEPISIWTIALIVLLLGIIVYVSRFVIQLASVAKLRINSKSEKMDSFCLVKLKNKNISPFSFFKWIFINPENHSLSELDEILAHEQIHVHQYHSVDVLLFELLCICFWWNPFVWLLKKEMRLNLEYLADNGVLEAGYNSKAYQYILLQSSNRNTGISLINNFNVSQLKKRIIMMNKKKSSMFSSIRYLLVIPIGVALLLGNAVQATSLDDFSLDQISLVSDGQQVPQKKENVYTTVEEMPSFPGGESAMFTFVGENLKYPVTAQEAGIQGRATIRFVVKATGEITDVEIIRDFDPDCDAEAIRTVKSMPKWNPGKHKGKVVDVYFTLPIVFKLTKGGSTKQKMTTAVVSQKKTTSVPVGQKSDKPFATVEVMPSFPGGESAMQVFIAENLKYPVSAQQAGIQGRIAVRFVIKATGDITDVEIVRGIDPACDAEAIRVVKAMPKWSPGKQKGEAVDVYFTLPIVFKLKKTTDTPEAKASL